MSSLVVRVQHSALVAIPLLLGGQTMNNRLLINLEGQLLRLDPVTLRLREHELDRELMNRPSTQAQIIECELIKNLSIRAPSLLSSVLAAETPRKLRKVK